MTLQRCVHANGTDLAAPNNAGPPPSQRVPLLPSPIHCHPLPSSPIPPPPHPHRRGPYAGRASPRPSPRPPVPAALPAAGAGAMIPKPMSQRDALDLPAGETSPAPASASRHTPGDDRAPHAEGGAVALLWGIIPRLVPGGAITFFGNGGNSGPKRPFCCFAPGSFDQKKI